MSTKPDYEYMARDINNDIQLGLNGIKNVFGNEQKNINIASVINNLRSAGPAQDVLSSYVLVSQELISTNIIGITDGLITVQDNVNKEGKRKQAEEIARLKAKQNTESDSDEI